jgi:hypothetical protein
LVDEHPLGRVDAGPVSDGAQVELQPEIGADLGRVDVDRLPVDAPDEFEAGTVVGAVDRPVTGD